MLVSVYRSPNIIERDAIMAYLTSEGVESFTGKRDVIVNLANEPNMSLEGYSAMFNGYDIFVSADQKNIAQEKIQQFLASTKKAHLEISNDSTLSQNAEQLLMDQGKLEKKILSILLFGILFPAINLPFVIAPLFQYFNRGCRPQSKFLMQFMLLMILNVIYLFVALKYVGPSIFNNKIII